MPYPAQVSPEGIARAARAIIETSGVEALSLAHLAESLGIRAPSLYRHYANKAALLRAVNALTIGDMTAAMQQAIAAAGSPLEGLMAMARAYRDYALANPNTYSLVYARHSHDTQPDDTLRLSFALPLQAAWEAACGPEESLVGLRGAWALLHGYVILEINQQFQRGGDVGAACMEAFACYVSGWLLRSRAVRDPA